MTATTRGRIPSHLLRYVVDQDYDRYTPEDHAVWRFILRQLRDYLSKHAHESYMAGLEKTGITIDRIPRISEIDEHLERLGWGAVPVSGFIPPAAFMEFQSLGILPIASDMRSIHHLLYTPAPDIVHEAAGHAPFLADPDYAAYLRRYGEVARHAIISRQDLEQYEAIRVLSDVKEHPDSTPEVIAAAEKRLVDVNNRISFVSEAALLSRMNWWTAEYGLVGRLNEPKIYGAGLLSSVGESRQCLSSRVKKIPLTVDCVDYGYDITEPQPQLFVADDFSHLSDVLDELKGRMAYRLGGEAGLKRAIEAETVNTVELDSGLQISGYLKDYVGPDFALGTYLRFEGPVQLAFDRDEIAGHGTTRHAHGYSTPVGPIKGQSMPLHKCTSSDLSRFGLRSGEKARLEFESGVVVEGEFIKPHFYNDQLVLLTFKNCRVTLGDQLLFDPAWGEYDMGVGAKIKSVFGGPADRERYGSTEDFVAQRVPPRKFTEKQKSRHDLFASIRDARENGVSADGFEKLCRSYLELDAADWLPGIELLEISYKRNIATEMRDTILQRLRPDQFTAEETRMAVEDGLRLARAGV